MPRRKVNQPPGSVNFDIEQAISDARAKLPPNATLDDIEELVLEEGQNFKANLFQKLAEQKHDGQKKSAYIAQEMS